MSKKASQKMLMPIIIGKDEARLAECLPDKNHTALDCRE